MNDDLTGRGAVCSVFLVFASTFPAVLSGRWRAWARFLPVALLAGLLTWRFVDQDGYDRVVAEDGPVEWATAAVYLLAAGAAAVAAWRFRRRRLWAAVVLYLLAATALFGIAG